MKDPLRIVFYGSPDFAVASLHALLTLPEARVVAVVTQPDKPAGRKRVLTPPPVKVAALQHSLPVYQFRKLRDGQAEHTLRAHKPDIAVVAAYGRILPKALLDVPACGSINVHASLLPRWRGASPIHHAIWFGDRETGVSLMQMDEGLDTGAVFVQHAVPIAETDTTERLTGTLAATGAAMLQHHLHDIARGHLRARAQPEAGIRHASLLTKELSQLDFRKSAVQLAREVRAFFPWPGSHVVIDDIRISVLEAIAVSMPTADHAPGRIVWADERGLGIACAEGVLLISRLKPAGRQEMSAQAWIAGRGAKKAATLR